MSALNSRMAKLIPGWAPGTTECDVRMIAESMRNDGARASKEGALDCAGCNGTYAHGLCAMCCSHSLAMCLGQGASQVVLQVCVSVRLHGIGHWAGTLIGLGNLQRGNKGAARHQLGCGRGAVARVRSSGDKPRDSNFHIFQRGDASGLRLAPIPCSFLTRDRGQD